MFEIEVWGLGFQVHGFRVRAGVMFISRLKLIRVCRGLGLLRAFQREGLLG